MAGFVTDFWCQEWDFSLTVCIDSSYGDTYIGFVMAARDTDCDSCYKSLGMKLREDVFIFHVRMGLRP